METNRLRKLLILSAMGLPGCFMQACLAEPDSYHLLDDCIEDKGWETDTLIDVCTQAIDVQTINKKKTAHVYMKRGSGYGLKGENQKALDDFTKSIELDPEQADAYLNRVLIWIRLDDYERAMSDANQAILMRPRYPQGYYNRSHVWYRLGNLENTIKDIDQAVKLRPKFHFYLHASCYTRAIAGVELDSALFACTKAIKRTKNSAKYYATRSMVNIRLDRFEDAISDTDRAIKIDPELADSYFFRGLAKLRLNQNEEGSADLTRARQLNPEIGNLYAVWGFVP